MFWILLFAIGGAWVVQSWFSFKQTQAFTRLFIDLRRKGRVAMGKFRGGIAAGAIVMFVLDDEDRITEGHRLGGVTVLARFREFDDFTGQHMGDVDPQQAERHGKPVMRAVANARDNFRVVSEGGVPAEPPTAVARLLEKLPAVKPKQRVLPTPGGAAPAQKKVVRRKVAA